MSVKMNVWYPKGENVGHASVDFHGTYMSWWPDGSAASKKVKMLLQLFAGGPAQAPTYKDDCNMEGGDPSWTGDFFGWENDDKAIQLWKTMFFSDYQKAISASRSGNPGAQYSFISQNCCDVVDKMLNAAGAYEWQVKLNVWRSVKTMLAPKDIATIGCYLGGQTGILNSPGMWSPVPDYRE